MSASEPEDDGGAVPINGRGLAKPTLSLPDPNEELKVQPLVARLVRGQFTWDTNSFTTLGGEVITQDGPPQAGRITLEGIISQSQLQEMFRLMKRTRRVRFISEPFTQTVTFDTFQIEHDEKLSQRTLTKNGTRITEAIYSFQLQQKERNWSSVGGDIGDGDGSFIDGV